MHGIKRRASSFNTGRIDHLYQDPHESDPRLVLHYGDLTDSTNLIRIIQQAQPDEIYNLGAQSHVAVSFEAPEYTANSDALGTLRILEAVRMLGPTAKTRIYQASTSELYGLGRRSPQKETTPFYPRSPYECCSSQAGQRTSAIAPVAVGVLVELGVTDPVPALNAPAVPHQLQQCFWGGSQACEKQMGGMEGLAVSDAGGHHLNNPAGASPVLADVLWCLLCPQPPGHVAAMADLLIRCQKRDLALPLELAANLAVENPLIRFHGQEEVGPLLLELPKNGFWVCRASA